jgi:PKD-like domain/Secretion system C-terminal sorting domain
MKKNKPLIKKTMLHLLLFLFPAFGFTQGSISGPTSCYAYVCPTSNPNKYIYTLNYTPPPGYSLSGGYPTWVISGCNYQSYVSSNTNEIEVGWLETHCWSDGSIMAYATYTHAPIDPSLFPDINIITPKLAVDIACLNEPTSMTGIFSIPCNTQPVIQYCVPAVYNATSYEWDYPSGWMPLAGSLTNQNCITLVPSLLTPGTTSGQISVRARNDQQGLISFWYTKTISPRAPATAPSFVNPILNVCASKQTVLAGVGYSITSVSSASSYTWGINNSNHFINPSLPTGTSAKASIGFAGGITTISASAMNACGTGPAASINVTVSTAITAPTGGSLQMNDGTGHCWSTATIDPVNGAISYIWTSPSAITTTDPFNPRHLFAGNVYTISVRAQNNCGTSSAYTYTGTAVICKAANGINSGSTSGDETNELSIYPNPANSSFEINLPDHESVVRIVMTNITGQVIKDFTTNEAKTIIESATIPAGLYIINISSDKINTVSKIQIVK